MDYMYMDVNGIPMKADAETMALVAVLAPGADGSIIERDPTERESSMWTRDLFWSGSMIGRATAEKLAYDRNYAY